jgi:hypothetical protein
MSNGAQSQIVISACTRARACRECAKMKCKCDNKRPCSRCIRLNKQQFCQDQDPKLTLEHLKSLLEAPPKVRQACARCRLRKQKCNGRLPCDRCLSDGLSEVCCFEGQSSTKALVLPESTCVILPKEIKCDIIYLLNGPSLKFDYPANFDLGFNELLNLSPLSIYESLCRLTDEMLVGLYGCAELFFSLNGAIRFFEGVLQGLEQLAMVQGETELLLTTMNRIQWLCTIDTEMLDGPHVKQQTQPSLDTPSPDELNSVGMFEHIDPLEAEEIRGYFERSSEGLKQLTGASDDMIACIVSRLGFARENDPMHASTFFLNRQAEESLGYTSQELNHYIRIRDLQNSWIFQTTGEKYVPAALGIYDSADWVLHGGILARTWLEGKHCILKQRSRNRSGQQITNLVECCGLIQSQYCNAVHVVSYMVQIPESIHES